MRYYETLYIVNPNYEGDHLDATVKKVNAEIEKNGATIINHRIWGKKRLAYMIQKHKYGTYILIQFETDNTAFIKDLELFLRLNKAIIRYQTIKLDECPEEFQEGEDSSAPEKKTDTTDKDVVEDEKANLGDIVAEDKATDDEPEEKTATETTEV